jgi:UDP-2-acetamido-3-amino-2,3-dideoxy-glucuronate N-acetyltransferase
MLKFSNIEPDVKLGKDVAIFDFVNLYGCEIGNECRIGPFTEIQRTAKIGNKCKISSHVFICGGVTIEDNVFIGHGVMFTNDKWPRACNCKEEPAGKDDWTTIPTRICKGASIGSGCTILCGLTIGENAFVGAGSVVTKDVPANMIVVGNPAKVLREID